jgi:sugar (pentulose or hexulose) kinase
MLLQRLPAEWGIIRNRPGILSPARPILIDNKKERYILGVDLGTTNLKIGLFTTGLKRLADRSTPLIYDRKDKKTVEFDPDTMWNTFTGLLKDISDEDGYEFSNIDSISITSQNLTFTILDRDGGAKIPFISYLDKRAEKQARIIAGRFGSDLSSYCGLNSFGPGSFTAKILWFKEQEGCSLEKDDIICTLPGYFTYRLNGRNLLCRNLASLYDGYSIMTSEWRSDMLKFIGLERNQLPDIINTGSPIKMSHSVKNPVFKYEAEVFLAGNDQTANAVGNLATKDNIIINMGTSMVIYLLIGEIIGPFHKKTIWGQYIDDNYYEMFASDSGTYSLDWAVEKIMGKIDYNSFDQLVNEYAADNKKSRRFYFYPEKARTTMAWTGNGTEAERIISVFEGFCFYIKYILEEYLQTDYLSKKIYITGGGRMNLTLLSILASVLGVPVYRSSGDTLLGAAIIAGGSKVETEIDLEKIMPGQGIKNFYDKTYGKWIRNRPYT